MTSESTFAALPVRQRGTIEIIDTALKLYRRYFGVLIAWSAVVSLVSLLGSFIPFVGLFVYPLVYGSCACAIAAAVRGQRITFAQVWDFTKPRYGALILLVILTGLLLFVIVLAATMGGLLISVLGIAALAAASAPDIVSTTLGVIGFLIALVVGSVVSVLAYAWLGLVPIIACLEDDKRGAAAMGRAWELMKGSWLRVLGLSTLLTIAIIAVIAAAAATLALTGQGFGALLENPDSWLGFSFAISGTLTLFGFFWNPVQALILSVLYLDLRVRKEALDLEWTSYTSAPQPLAPADAPAFDAVTGAPAQFSAGAQPLQSNAMPNTAIPDAATLFGSPPSLDPAPVSLDKAPSLDKTPVSTSPFAPPEPARPPSPFAPSEPPALPASIEPPTRPPAPQTSQTAPDNFDFSSSFSAGTEDNAGGADDAETRV